MIKKQVLIAGEIFLFSLGIEAILKTIFNNLITYHIAKNELEVIDILKNNKIDILYNALLQDENQEIEFTETIRKINECINIVSISGNSKINHFKKLKLYNVSIICKLSGTMEDVINSYNYACKGECFFSSCIIENFIENVDTSKTIFTDNEKNIIKLLSKGFAIKQIAAQTEIAKRTLERNIGELRTRLNVKNNIELVMKSYEMKLF